MRIKDIGSVSSLLNAFKDGWTPKNYRYPLTVILKDRYKTSPHCKNTRPKEKVKFMVNKVPATGMFEWKFSACLFDDQNKQCKVNAL